jgi:hypothetical protein
VPLIRTLEKENKIIIGVTPVVKKIFEEEFPHLPQIDLPSYNIKYSRWLPLWLKLVLEWLRILKVIKKENSHLQEIIQSHKVEVVISDNRFGLFSNAVHTIFITHQVFLKTPFSSGLAQIKNRNYINNFNELWIPDYELEERSLSGELSHGNHFHQHVTYIGPLSRLTKTDSLQEQKYDYLFLLSGPEPQQTLLRKKLLKKVAQYPALKFAIVANTGQTSEYNNLDVFVFPGQQQLSGLIATSKKIICRSGYSTLMDLHLLGKKDLILIPTPGQTEQEYLAAYWEKRFGTISLKQKQVRDYLF